MTPFEKFIQTSKPRIDAKILAYYKSFKTFICCNELPDFTIQYVDSRKDKSIKYKAQILPYQNPILLRINIAYLNEKDETFKTTLVHEFTHMYDYYMQSKKYDNNFLKRNLMLYTEYHAVQIEILFCYHIITKITDYADFMKTNLITMLDLPFEKFQIYKECFISYYKDKTLYNFYRVKTSYMYACGASALLSELMNRKMSFIKFEKPYQEQMQQIIDLLLTVKYDEIPLGELLEKIGKIDSQIKMF